ncbi:MAG: hypothetical protein AAGD07_21185 [Planctomycetota bacterium]
MRDRPPVNDAATRPSHHTIDFRLTQIIDLLIEADRRGLHLVTAAMIAEDRREVTNAN